MTSILIVLPNNLGDVIMALPVLRALKRESPDSSITFFVEEGFEGGLINCTDIDRLHLFPRKQIRNLLNSDKWADGIELLKKHIDILRELHIDRIINLCQHTYISTLLAQFDSWDICGRYFLPQGCHSISDSWSRYLYSIPYSRASNMLHATDVYRYIARVEHIAEHGKITTLPAETEAARKFLTDAGMPAGARCVLVHPGAAYLSKMWPVDYVITLVKKLIIDGFWVVITGSKSEAWIAETVRHETGSHCIAAAGNLSFRESFTLSTMAEYCITGDTAMMHAAAALGSKVYALFGPTNPVETGPWGAGHVIFSGQCASRPCFCFECTTKQCMKSISPETVYTYITHGDHSNAVCDIYTTTINDDGTYGIIPVREKGAPYYFKPYAEILRKVFDKSFELSCTPEETSFAKNELQKVENRILSMEAQLSSFIENSNPASIHEYEELKATLEKTGGITGFLSAYLNTGLNSIPLTNPRGSVQKSLQICRNFRLQIHETVNAL
ncbi:MAG: glycosyltransferase family 9 protein [Chitinispirillaceae bacterium]|nr:glycosyltransferase family 9 protein [Chitinispirillaceae bacterium]